MITHFIKPAEEQNLVRCAVIILLCSLFTVVAPFAAAGGLRFVFRQLPLELCFAIPFTLWAAYLISQCRRVIGMIRSASFCDTSPSALHVIQGVAILLFALNMALGGHLTGEMLSIWVICVDCALFAFFIAYFLLAAFSRMRIPWHSYLGFLIVCGALYYAAKH